MSSLYSPPSSVPSLEDLVETSEPRRRELLLETVFCATSSSETLKTTAIDLILQVLKDDRYADTLVDLIWFVDSLPTTTESLTHLIQRLLTGSPPTLRKELQSHLNPQRLQQLGWLTDEKELTVKLRRLNTQNYRQPKYNLLQEESEGYAKILYRLSTLNSSTALALASELQTLVGTFELDPNRVLDLLVDVLQVHLQQQPPPPQQQQDLPPLVPLIQTLALENLPPLMGFKLRTTSDPATLVDTLAFLARHKLLDLKRMAVYLDVSTTQIQETHQLFVKTERTRIQALGRILLTNTNNTQAQQDETLKLKCTQLQNTAMVQLLHRLLQSREWTLANDLLPYHSIQQLCTLLPLNIGLEVVDLAQQRIQSLHNTIWNDADQDLNTFSLEQITKFISDPLLCTLEPGCIRYRPIFYCQLCRLYRRFLTTTTIPDSVFRFFKIFLVPSLGLFSPSPAMSTELWHTLQKLPYTVRYKLYQEWRGIGLERAALHSKPLSLVETEMNAGKNSRYLLKRLSKENVRDTMSRQIAKVTHSSPLVVFSTILNQIESYDNLIQVMVEAVRFVTPLSLDVLGYCILSRLSSGGNRSRLKEDGVHVSQWLQSLESFTGEFYKQCPHVEFRGILCYLMNRLKEGTVMELGILQRLLKIAGGWGFADYSPAASLSATQLEGRAGSAFLKRETMTFGVVEGVNLRASQQIRSVLQSDDMGVSMLILLAQARSRVVFETAAGSPKLVKLVGNLHDSCQVVMSILLDFLVESADEQTAEASGPQGLSYAISKYAQAMPSLEELTESYGVDFCSAWMLCRPLIRAASHAVPESGELESKSTGDPLSRFAMSESIRTAIQKMLPADTWSTMTKDLFEMFYTLTLYDLSCPENLYTTEINRLKKEIERLSQRPSGGVQNAPPGSLQMRAEEDELARVKQAATVLASDCAKQKKRVQAVKEAVAAKASSFFVSKDPSREAVNSFLTHCVLPRSMESPDDAMYCAHFALLLHSIEADGFSTLHYMDQLVSALVASLYCVTENEAANVAILLFETLKVASKWRYDERAFTAELKGKNGSFMNLIPEEASDSGPVPISYDEYKLLYKKWHAAIGAFALGCLKSEEYMHTRACLVVLTRIVEVFPTRPALGNQLLTALLPLQDEKSLPDIKASAQAYGTLLVKARDEGRWKEEDAAAKQARAQKDQAEAEERKKKVAAQLEEMKRDSEMITAEIGDSRTRDRDRRNRHFPRMEDSRDSHTPKPSSMPNFEPADGNRKREDTPPFGQSSRRNAGESDDRKGSGRIEREGTNRRSDPVSSRASRGDGEQPLDRGRDRGRSSTEDRRHRRGEPYNDPAGRPGDRNHGGLGVDSQRGSRGDDRRGLGARWEQKQNTSKPPKRGRSPSPPDGNVDRHNVNRDDRPSKRSRSDQGSGRDLEQTTRAEKGGGSRGSSPSSRRTRASSRGSRRSTRR